MAGKLEGKVAFITGAARGQGRAHAVRLAQEGADIIAIDSCLGDGVDPTTGATDADFAETVKQVEALDRRIFWRKADVRDWDQLKAAVDEGVAELGRLDIVSGNAGISGDPNQTDVLSEEGWNDMIDVNLTGVWRTVKAAIPHLKAAGGGSIVLTSSEAGIRGFQNMAHYVSAKHGLVGLMRTLALELGPHNIRVNSIHPTQVDTPMIMNEKIFGLFAPDNPTKEAFEKVSQSMHVMPTPWIEAVDISNALLFLSSDDGRYITGVALPVDLGAQLI